MTSICQKVGFLLLWSSLDGEMSVASDVEVEERHITLDDAL